jgi:hypothetical protein
MDMRTNRRLFVLLLLLALLTAACSGGGTSTGGGNGGGGGGGGGGGAQIAGVWEGNIQLTERRKVSVPKPPPTDFPGQMTTIDTNCTLSGTLTFRLERQGSGVTASGDGSAKDGCNMREGDATGTGTVTAGEREIAFSTFNLLGCTLAPFTATVTDDNLTADVTGGAATPDCRLVMGHLQLHRTG